MSNFVERGRPPRESPALSFFPLGMGWLEGKGCLGRDHGDGHGATLKRPNRATHKVAAYTGHGGHSPAHWVELAAVKLSA